MSNKVPVVVCDSPDSLTDEIKYLDNIFNKNNYNRDFIYRIMFLRTLVRLCRISPVFSTFLYTLVGLCPISLVFLTFLRTLVRLYSN